MIAETLLALLIVGFLAVYAVVELVQWHNRVKYRKLERLVERNTWRYMGGRP